jgi:hypothetical protein
MKYLINSNFAGPDVLSWSPQLEPLRVERLSGQWGPDSGRTSIGMAEATVASSTRSLVASFGPCTLAWCMCVVGCELHVPGTTVGASSTSISAPFMVLCGERSR